MKDSATERLIIHGATIVTVDSDDTVIQGDISIVDGRIECVDPFIQPEPDDQVINVSGMIVMPAFVQTHVHTGQTLWRNRADDMSLMDWLWRRTWPYEAALDHDMVKASVRLAAAELLMSGTLLINDFGLVNHSETIVDAARDTGIRGVWGRILMDDHDGPESLRDDPEKAIAQAIELASAFENETNRPGCVAGYSINPRFAVTSSIRLLELVKYASQQHGLPVHTHCSENDEENALTGARFGVRPVRLYERLRMLGPNLRLAHCVRVTDDEIMMLAESDTMVLHCPTTNLKLGSGVAPVPKMLAAGICVSLGADGAPANNNLNMFNEMRTASLIQKTVHGPEAMPAATVIRMATVNGARALGLDSETGSIEPGKRADLLVLDPAKPHSIGFDDPCPAIVYSMNRDNVVHVLSAGRFAVKDGIPAFFDPDAACAEATRQTARLMEMVPGTCR